MENNSIQIIDKRASVIEMPENEVSTDIATFNPMQLIQIAVQGKYDLDYIDRLMGMQERWEKREAEKAFIVAMSEFKKNPPTIIKEMAVKYRTKTGGITSYNHASLGNAVYSIIGELSKHRLDSTWESSVDMKAKTVTITNVLRHTDGHCQKYSLTAGFDYSGGKNEIHAMRSTVTHLERYTLLDNTGLATNEHEISGELDHPNNPKTKPTTNHVAFDKIIKQAVDLLTEIPIDDNDKQAWLDSLEGVSSDRMAKEALSTIQNLYSVNLKEMKADIGMKLMSVMEGDTASEKQKNAVRFMEKHFNISSRKQITSIKKAKEILAKLQEAA